MSNGCCRWFSRGAAVAAVVIAIGCNSAPTVKTYTVRGTVINKRTGQPVTKFENGWVVLEAGADVGKVVQGTIEEDGTFSIGSVIDGKAVPGVPAGDYRVRVVPLPDDTTGKGNRRLIDPKYMKFETSGLRLSVSGDMTDVKFEVEMPK